MKQFKTRDSATAFMRKAGVKKEHYNNFISSEVVGGKPIFTVDTDEMETYLDLKKNLGDQVVDGNYDKENQDGLIGKGDYYNDDGSLKKDELKEENEEVEAVQEAKTKSPKKKKTPPLAGSALDERTRQRLKDKEKPAVKFEERKRTKMKKDSDGNKVRRPPLKKEPVAKVPPTKGILKSYPDVTTKSIRAFIVYLLLEGLDDHQIFGGVKEVFGEEKAEGKETYPRYYRKQLIKSKQLDENGKPTKH